MQCVMSGFRFVCWQAVPYDLSLATVHDFIWQRKERPQEGELCILYRIRDHANPAPMPKLEPQLCIV